MKSMGIIKFTMPDSILDFLCVSNSCSNSCSMRDSPLVSSFCSMLGYPPVSNSCSMRGSPTVSNSCSILGFPSVSKFDPMLGSSSSSNTNFSCEAPHPACGRTHICLGQLAGPWGNEPGGKGLASREGIHKYLDLGVPHRDREIESMPSRLIYTHTYIRNVIALRE